jgi:hypothetical protein
MIPERGFAVRFLKRFRWRLARLWRYVLRRRSQKSRVSWKKAGAVCSSSACTDLCGGGQQRPSLLRDTGTRQSAAGNGLCWSNGPVDSSDARASGFEIRTFRTAKRRRARVSREATAPTLGATGRLAPGSLHPQARHEPLPQPGRRAAVPAPDRARLAGRLGAHARPKVRARPDCLARTGGGRAAPDRRLTTRSGRSYPGPRLHERRCGRGTPARLLLRLR